MKNAMLFVTLILLSTVVPVSASTITYVNTVSGSDYSYENFASSATFNGNEIYYVDFPGNITFRLVTTAFANGWPDSGVAYFRLQNVNTSTTYNITSRSSEGTTLTTIYRSDIPDGYYRVQLYIYSRETGDDVCGISASISQVSIVDSYEPEPEYISFDQSTYYSGDVAIISWDIPDYIAWDSGNPYANEYYIDIQSQDPATGVWSTMDRRFLYTQAGNTTYTVPSYSSRQFRANLMYRANVLTNPTEIGTASMQMTASGVLLAFNQTTYPINGAVTWHYSNMPANTTLQLRMGNTATPALLQQTTVSGNSTGSYTLTNGPYSTRLLLEAYDGNTRLAFDEAYTATAPIGNSQLSGRVRDAATGAPIEGATVQLAATSTTTDSNGDYSIVIPKGTWTISTSKSGYITKTFSDFTFSSSGYTYNPTLQPNPAASGTLHVTVTNKATGGNVVATVTASNGTWTRSTVTNSQGYGEIAGLISGQAYAIKASNTAFEAYVATLNFSSSSNAYAIQLIPTAGQGAVEPGSGGSTGGSTGGSVSPGGSTGTGGSSGTGSTGTGGVTPTDPTGGTSTTTTERPGRAAAKETMAELEVTVPKLVMFVVMMIFLAVMKKGAK